MGKFIDYEQLLDRFIISFVDSVYRVTKGSYGGRWPLPIFSNVDVGVAVDELWCDRFLNLIDFIEQNNQFQKVQKNVLYPSPLSRAFMANFQLKYLKYPYKKLLKKDFFIIKLLQKFHNNFCINKKNFLWTKTRIKKIKINSFYKNLDLQYNGYLRILSEMLYFYFDNLCHEIHGPYKFANNLLIIKDWHDLKPPFFKFTKHLLFDQFRIYELYKANTKIQIDVSNRFYIENALSNIKACAFEVNGRFLDLDEILDLTENIKTTCSLGAQFLSKLNYKELFIKAAYTHFYILKPIFDAVNKKWNPPKSQIIKAIETELTERKAKQLINYLLKLKLDKKTIRSLFDPRLNLF